MRQITVCGKCGSSNIDLCDDWSMCYCKECNCETKSRDRYIESPFERAQSRVYTTGNRWAIENWNATHY